MAAVRLPTPNLPGGSSALPDCTTRLTATTGTSWRSTIQTGRPFESVRFWTGGSVSVGVGPSGGGAVRSGACARSDSVRSALASHACMSREPPVLIREPRAISREP